VMLSAAHKWSCYSRSLSPQARPALLQQQQLLLTLFPPLCSSVLQEDGCASTLTLFGVPFAAMSCCCGPALMYQVPTSLTPVFAIPICDYIRRSAACAEAVQAQLADALQSSHQPLCPWFNVACLDTVTSAAFPR
jgi:hypothetical protein